MTKTPLINMSEILAKTLDEDHCCRHCNKKFVKETSLAKHLCEPKRRFQSRQNKDVQIGLQAYLRFYQYTQGKTDRTWDDFAISPYYSAFVKFGIYCVTTPVFAPLQFLDWLLAGNKRIDHWPRDSLYNVFLLDLLKTEPVEDALSRAVKWSLDWSEDAQGAAKDCIRYSSQNLICHKISTGILSGWVIYNSDSGQKFLSSLNRDQLTVIYDYVDPDFWHLKFEKFFEDAAYAKEILKTAGW